MSENNKPTDAAVSDRATLRKRLEGYADPLDAAITVIQNHEARLEAMASQPTDAAVREAVEYYAPRYMGGCTEADLHLGTLLRAAQSPRLTEAQVEALKTAYLHVRHHGPQHDANAMLAVFPELQEMHERVFGKEG